MHIHIITTGGSIDKTYSTQASDFIVGEPSIADLLRAANVNLRYTVQSMFQKDSLQITEADRASIVAAVEASTDKHILITHGTDTMIATAKALEIVQDKVIVLTGAMQPSKFTYGDAALNIGTALAALQTCSEGVHIAMSGRVWHPDSVQKNPETDQFEAIT